MNKRISMILLSLMLTAAMMLVLLTTHWVMAAPVETLTVSKTADTADGTCDADCSLREAITAAESGDTILFDSSLAGQTMDISGLGQLVITKSLTIDGSGLVERPIVSGGTITRVFYITNSVDVALIGLSIQDGRSQDGADAVDAVNAGDNGEDGMEGGNGGAVYIVGGSLLISDTIMMNNAAGNGGNAGNGANNTGADAEAGNGGDGGNGGAGGSIYAEQSQLTVYNSQFQENRSGSGGIGGDGGDIEDEGTEAGNGFGLGFGGDGGAIYTVDSTVLIANSMFYSNTTGNGGNSGDGGDVINAAGEGVDVSAGGVFGSGDSGQGGALYHTRSTEPITAVVVTISNTIFMSNTTGNGGDAGNGGDVIGHGGGNGDNTAGFGGAPGSAGQAGALYLNEVTAFITGSAFQWNGTGEVGQSGTAGTSVEPNGTDGFLISEIGDASEGGAIYSNDSDFTLTGGLIANNYLGQGEPAGQGGGMYISLSRADGYVFIDSVTIRENIVNNGEFDGVSSGGGVELSIFEGTVTFTNNIVEGNRVGNTVSAGFSEGSGAGLYFDALGGTHVVLNNRFIDNVCDVEGGATLGSTGGGAIFFLTPAFGDGMVAEIANNHFEGNECGVGAGMRLIADPFGVPYTITVDHNSFVENTAYPFTSTSGTAESIGGGVSLFIGGDGTTANRFEFAHNRIVQNDAAGFGGGLYIQTDSQSVWFENNEISENSAAQGGGAYFASGDQPLYLVNTLVAGNTAITETGGGIVVDSTDSLVLLNTTVTGNSAAAGSGGGLYASESTVDVINSIMWNNLDQAGTMSVTASVASMTSTVTVSNSIVANSGGSESWNSTVGTDGGGNLDSDPLFVEPLDPASAPASSRNLTVDTNSPAVDAGDTAAYSAITTQAFDLGGYDRIANSVINIGAYETTQYWLDLAITGPLTGTVSGLSVDCAADCSEAFAAGTTITLTANPAVGAMVTWSGACSGSDDCVVTMDSSQAVTATFDVAQLGLTTTVAGNGSGAIDQSPEGTVFDFGTVVTLTATADADSVFAGWSGDCTGMGDCVLTMDSAKSVTAQFDEAGPAFQIYLPLVLRP